MSTVPIDRQDYHRLLARVLVQAMNDYTRLQRPSARKRKYVHEAFLTAIALFQDPEYQLECFANEDGEPMSLEDLVLAASDRSNVNMEELRRHLVSNAREQNKESPRKTEIPAAISILGNVYLVLQGEADLDHDRFLIEVDREGGDLEGFMELVLEALAFHANLTRLPVKLRRHLAEVLAELIDHNELGRA